MAPFKPFPDQSNLAEAKRIYRNYCRRIDRLRMKARQGDREAARKIISVLADMEGKIKDLGCRIAGEDGEKHDIVPITQQWLDEQKAKETELDRWTKKARTGDQEAIRKVVMLLAQGAQHG
jgi:hypothetical protein